MTVRIIIEPDTIGEQFVWTASMLEDDSPHSDAYGASPIDALSKLAFSLGEQLTGLEKEKTS